MTFTQIPIINFAPFTEGNATEKQAVIEQIYAACHQVGFMYLQNIGISRGSMSLLQFTDFAPIPSPSPQGEGSKIQSLSP